MKKLNHHLTLILIASLLISQAAKADPQIYNPRLGSLEIDISSDLNFKIPISLHYSSRSLFDGFLGRGWCSSYDWKITQLNNLRILQKCEEKRVLKRDEYIETSHLFILKNEFGFRTGFSLKEKSVLFSQRVDGNEIYILSRSFPNIVKKGPLLKSLSFSSHSFIFEYDQMDNLILIKNKNKDALVVNYDPRMDLLLTAEIIGSCQIQLNYSRADLTLKTLVTQKCPQKQTTQTLYLDHFQKRKDATLKLLKSEKISTLPEELK